MKIVIRLVPKATGGTARSTREEKARSRTDSFQRIHNPTTSPRPFTPWTHVSERRVYLEQDM